MTQWRIIQYLTTVLLVVLLCPLPLLADNGDGDAGQPGEFLHYGTNIRSLALGRAYCALPGSATDVFHNPAGLVDLSSSFDLYGTHFEPLHMSSFNALALGYLFSDSGRIGSPFLYNSALAFGVISMNSDDYQYRTIQDIYVDDFGISQSAYAAAFAHRFTTTYALLDVGISGKVLAESITDVATYDADAHFTYGFGLQIKLIHPPLINKFAPLKALMPLRIGFVMQNINQPTLGLGNGHDVFPRTYRIGFAYQYDGIRADDILVTVDGEKREWGNRGWTWHTGAEFQLYMIEICLMPRVGLVFGNDDTDFTFGFGLQTSHWGVQTSFDFAYGINDEFRDDIRVGLRLSFGIERNAAQYLSRSRAADSALSYNRSMALNALMCYPYANDGVSQKSIDPAILDAAEDLATKLDTGNAERYFDFVGGYRYGEYLVKQARDDLRAKKCEEALKKAHQALSLFGGKEDRLDTAAYRYWGEAFLIIAEVISPDNASSSCCSCNLDPSLSDLTIDQLADSALSKFDRSSVSNEIMYMKARCYQFKHLWSDARGLYAKILEDSFLSHVDSALALIGYAASLVAQQRSADSQSMLDPINALETNVNSYDNGRLPDTYLPYPPYFDFSVADNSQLLIAQLYEKWNGHEQDAKLAYARLLKIYPHLDCAVESKSNVNGHIEELLK